ncbi:GtrA family protein [Polynucleobacter sp. QLW-P1DATA-2]|uniref:GtrA family protein n=1 Tax=Polynucleobacter sp. QLW-P1DATA-2 TaxID=1743167 RepID=UPI0008F7E76A|nr:GtrA family protein [Polynucleobacter sp. QLW-P1DATA-2]OIN00904.1 GtrA family protein [Polynucleobacter sp. QLW-P1DATA-2]
MKKKYVFLIAGGVNTLVGFLVYPLLYLALSPVGFGYIQILLAAQIPCITFSFATNKYFVFRTKGNLKKEYLKFTVFYAVILLINLIFLPILVEIFGVSPIISQTLFVALTIVTSFFWHNFITFKPI